MNIQEWSLVGLCILTLVTSVGVHVQTLRWTRRMVATDRELMGQLRLVMEDVLSRDPQLAEPIELALHELDDWEKRMNYVGKVSFMRAPKRR